MRDVDDRGRSPPGGPELLSVVVLILAAVLIATALSYSWVVARDATVPAAEVPRPGLRSLVCSTMASCDGDRGISPGSSRASM